MLPPMGIETIGRLHIITETKKVSERFSKREFVVEIADNPKYPQLVQFQLTGDRCEQLDRFSVGDEVRLDFSLRGREWKSPSGEVKYFNSLDVWKVEPARGGGGGGGGGRGGRDGGDRGGRDTGGGGYRGGDDVPPPRDDDYRGDGGGGGRSGGGGGGNDDDIPF